MLFVGVSGLSVIGKWSDPCVSSNTDHWKFGCMSGLQNVRSMDVVFKLCWFCHVGVLLMFMMDVFVFVKKSSTTLPFWSWGSLPQSGLWALKSPKMIKGFGSWSLSSISSFSVRWWFGGM